MTNNMTLVTSAYLILTENCNLRCKYCFEQNSRTVTSYMPESTALKVVDYLIGNALKLKEAGRNQVKAGITFFGGEPCLCPELMEKVVEYGVAQAKEKGVDFDFSIITNGTIYNDKLESFLEKWCELTNNRIAIQLSIDGIPEIQDLNRPCAISTQKSSDLIAENVVKFKDFIKKHNIAAERLQLHAVVSKSSLPRIFDSFKYFYQDLKIYNSQFAWVIEDKWDDNDVAILDDQLGKIVNYLTKITTNVKRFPFKNFDHCSGCSSGKQLMCVDTEGNIYPCHRFFFFARNNPELIFGNIHDENLDLENNEVRKPFLEFDAGKIDDICQICMATNYECTNSLYERPSHYDAKFMEVINDWYSTYEQACTQKMMLDAINGLRKEVNYLKRVIEVNGLTLDPEDTDKKCNCGGNCHCKKDEDNAMEE